MLGLWWDVTHSNSYTIACFRLSGKTCSDTTYCTYPYFFMTSMCLENVNLKQCCRKNLLSELNEQNQFSLSVIVLLFQVHLLFSAGSVCPVKTAAAVMTMFKSWDAEWERFLLTVKLCIHACAKVQIQPYNRINHFTLRHHSINNIS